MSSTTNLDPTNYHFTHLHFNRNRVYCIEQTLLNEITYYK